MAGVELRLDSIEGRMDRLDGRMERMETRFGAVEQKVSEISGKLDVLVSQVVAKLPSWWQMPVVIGSTVLLLGLLLTAAEKLHLAGL